MKHFLFEILRWLLIVLTGHGYDRSPAVNNLHHRLSFRLHKLLPWFGIRGVQRVSVPMLPNTSMYVRAEDGGVGHQLLMYRHYEPFETRLLKSYAKPGMTVYNVGANLGYYVLHLADCVGAKGRVVAFEPAPANLELLRQTVDQSRFGNVTIVEAAVGAKVGKTILALSETNSGDHQIIATDAKREGADAATMRMTHHAVADRSSVAVELTTLHAFCASKNELPSILVLDVQGSELDVLRGMSEILTKRMIDHPWMSDHPQKPEIIFTEFWPEGLNSREPNGARLFLELLVHSGFSLHIIDERKKDLIPTTVEALIATTTGHEERNVLAIRTNVQSSH